jgi:hypothetical protein
MLLTPLGTTVRLVRELTSPTRKCKRLGLLRVANADSAAVSLLVLLPVSDAPTVVGMPLDSAFEERATTGAFDTVGRELITWLGGHGRRHHSATTRTMRFLGSH